MAKKIVKKKKLKIVPFLIVLLILIGLSFGVYQVLKANIKNIVIGPNITKMRFNKSKKTKKTQKKACQNKPFDFKFCFSFSICLLSKQCLNTVSWFVFCGDNA